MAKLSENKISFVVGLYIAILHALWAGLVALGVGQSFLDLVFPLHFIANVYSVLEFSLLNAVVLTIFAFIGSYLATLLFIALWKLVKIK